MGCQFCIKWYTMGCMKMWLDTIDTNDLIIVVFVGGLILQIGMILRNIPMAGVKCFFGLDGNSGTPKYQIPPKKQGFNIYNINHTWMRFQTSALSCVGQIPTITPLVICLGLLGHVPSVGCQGSVTWCSEPKAAATPQRELVRHGLKFHCWPEEKHCTPKPNGQSSFSRFIPHFQTHPHHPTLLNSGGQHPSNLLEC